MLLAGQTHAGFEYPMKPPVETNNEYGFYLLNDKQYRLPNDSVLKNEWCGRARNTRLDGTKDTMVGKALHFMYKNCAYPTAYALLPDSYVPAPLLWKENPCSDSENSTQYAIYPKGTEVAVENYYLPNGSLMYVEKNEKWFPISGSVYSRFTVTVAIPISNEEALPQVRPVYQHKDDFSFQIDRCGGLLIAGGQTQDAWISLPFDLKISDKKTFPAETPIPPSTFLQPGTELKNTNCGVVDLNSTR